MTKEEKEELLFGISGQAAQLIYTRMSTANKLKAKSGEQFTFLDMLDASVKAAAYCAMWYFEQVRPTCGWNEFVKEVSGALEEELDIINVGTKQKDAERKSAFADFINDELFDDEEQDNVQ